MTAPFRILSLDGGGTWALIQVRALMALYPDARSGHDVLRHFDLGISNSGGSIVLAGMAANMKLEELDHLFLDPQARGRIFEPVPFGPLLKRYGLGPRYRAAAKLEGLRDAVGSPGDVRMSDWELKNHAGREVRLVICGFDYERLREVFFRTKPGPPDTRPDHPDPLATQLAVMDATFAQAVHASSNAPVTYFDAPATWGTGQARFWDGAMGGYNNPVLAGVVEAVGGMRPDDRATVRVLSLGTGSVVRPERGSASDNGLLLPRRADGLIPYATAAATCILDDPPDAASYVAHVMLGGGLPERVGHRVENGPLVRMSPLIQPVKGRGYDWTTPRGLDIAEFMALLGTDMDAVAQSDVDRIARLADLWIAPPADDGAGIEVVRNQPIRASRWLEAEIGHATFAAARESWVGERSG